ncbi:MAG TPA: MYXO-CTERM sorting domain-containing protein [Polyangiaceae bacterium]|nr:MYXO-CTERM sorting domain-containing protein [Polyangiaceae bacterium]
MMLTYRSTAFALLLAAPLLFATPAAADVAPVNSCNTEGSDCTNGLPEGANPWGPGPFAPGICTKKTCSRGSPDGGVVHYDCLLCVATPGQGGSPGTGGSTAAGGNGTGGAPTAGKSGSSGGSDGCSCRVPGGAKPWTLAGAMLVVGIVALAGGRRRTR